MSTVDDTTGLENPLLADEVPVEEAVAEEAVDPTQMTFSMVIGNAQRRSDGYAWGDDRSGWWARSGTNRGDLTYEELEEFYNEQGATLHQVFPSFDDYLGYMVAREALIQNDPGFMFAEGGELAADHMWQWLTLTTKQREEGLTPEEQAQLDAINEYRDSTGQPGYTMEYENPYYEEWTDYDDMYDKFMSSPEMVALNEQYGIDPNGTFTDEDGSVLMWTGSGMVMTEDNKGHWTDLAGNVLIGGALAVMTGGVAGGFMGGLNPVVAGALKGTLGSAVGQLATTGKLSPESLATAAILGGMGGYFDQLANMDSAIADGGVLGFGDDVVTGLSDVLNIPYDEALAIVEGVVNGAITGQDLEGIILGAVGQWGADRTMDFLQATYGDTIQVDDWFKDGASNIPVEALEPFVDQIIQGAINGDLDDPGAWLETVWNYFQSGGDVDFMLPDGVDLSGLFSLGSFDLSVCRTPEDGSEKPWYCNIDLSAPGGFEIGNPCSDEQGNEGVLNQLGLCEFNPCGVDENGNPGVLNAMGLCEFPDIDIPIDGELPKLGDPCTTESGQEGTLIGGALEGTFICEGIGGGGVDPFGCAEGETWSETLGACVPDVVECIEGFEWDGQQCVKIPDVPDILPEGTDCEEGFAFDSLLGQCVEIDIDTGEGPDWEIGDPCEDEEGNQGVLDEMGLCNISLPDLPSGPGITTGTYSPTWGQLFAYTPFTPAIGKKIADVDLGLLSQARDYLK